MTVFLGEIRLFAGNFAPSGFLFCEGQLLPISQYDALFSLLGTFYGGDGRTTFALPDLRSRVALHEGQGPGLTNRSIGSRAGADTVSLAAGNVPAHSHRLQASSGAPATENAGVLCAAPVYEGPGAGTLGALAGQTVEATPPTPAQPHENRQPYLSLSYIICAQGGIYPSRN